MAKKKSVLKEFDLKEELDREIINRDRTPRFILEALEAATNELELISKGATPNPATFQAIKEGRRIINLWDGRA